MLSPYKFNYGQITSTDAEGVSVDRSFLAHVHIPAATIVNSATALEGNTADMSGTPNGLKDIDLYIIV